MIYVLGGGGGIKDAFAVISVTYPVGSTCTCSNGTKTLTAKDTSGSYVFPIPEAGTWTVRAYNGVTWESSDHRKSTEVTIVSQYQIKNVILNYELYIIENGTFKNSFAINSNFGAVVTSPSGYLKVGATAKGDNIGGTVAVTFGPIIDLSGFSILKADVSAGYTQTARIGLYPSADSRGTPLASVGCSDGDRRTLALSLNIAQNGYAGVYYNTQHNYSVCAVNFYNLWLE